MTGDHLGGYAGAGRLRPVPRPRNARGEPGAERRGTVYVARGHPAGRRWRAAWWARRAARWALYAAGAAALAAAALGAGLAVLLPTW